MKINPNLSVSNVSTFEDLRKFVAIALQDLVTAFNGKVGVPDNLDVSIIDATINGSGSDTPVSHGLRRIPVGYLVAGLNANTAVYTGSKTWTNELIYLRSGSAVTAKLIFF